MARVEVLTDIPSGEVNEVAESFKREGAAVEIIEQPDGKWTVRATFPD